MSGLTWLVKQVQHSPLPALIVTFFIAIACWGGAWALQTMVYIPTILLSIGCASVVLVIGVTVYVLVAKVERND